MVGAAVADSNTTASASSKDTRYLQQAAILAVGLVPGVQLSLFWDKT